MASNFKKIAAGAAAVLVLAAGAFGAAQSTSVDDAANGLKRVALKANGL